MTDEELVSILKVAVADKLKEERTLFSKEPYIHVRVGKEKFLLYLTASEDEIVIECVSDFVNQSPHPN